MPKKTPFEEVCSLFKIAPEPGESYERFACRATDAINKCSDAQWKELSLAVQTWTNSTLEAREVNKAPNKEARETASHLQGLLPSLDGYVEPEEAADDEEAPGEEEADDGAEENTEPEPEGEEEEATDDDDDGDAEEDDKGDDSDDAEESGDGEESSEEEQQEEVEQEPVARHKSKDYKEKTGKGAKAAPSKTGKDKKVAKAAVAKKAAAPAASGKKNGAGGSSRRNIGDKDTIKILAKKNPYRDGSLGAKVFGKYKDGMTVAQLTSATKSLALTRPVAAMLRFDANKGHIKVVPASDAA